jgi:hypothetical protein
VQVRCVSTLRNAEVLRLARRSWIEVGSECMPFARLVQIQGGGDVAARSNRERCPRNRALTT